VWNFMTVKIIVEKFYTGCFKMFPQTSRYRLVSPVVAVYCK